MRKKGGRAARAGGKAGGAARKKPATGAAAPRRSGLTAGDLMSREPITVREDMTVGELCDLFQVKNINGAPVVDRRGRLVGVVAQDDIIYGAMGNPGEAAARRAEPPDPPDGVPGTGSPARRTSRRVVAMLRERQLVSLPEVAPRPGERPFWADTRPQGEPLRMPVSAIMTSPAISAEEETPLKDLCHVMWNLRIHRVPIVRAGRVTGLVSSMDLCRAILDGLIKV
jgi:CBS domain-containing protein